jgi:DNA (cytosine-5)-methyltransferase 1
LDYLAPAAATWSNNHTGAISCCGDIKQVNPEDIKDMLTDKGIHHINMLTGSPPCQGHSRTNRKRNDNDSRNYLYIEYLRFVEAFQPDYTLLENVVGLRSTAGGRFEKEITQQLEALGYSVTVQVVNAADYGVPQLRKRLVIVGVKKGRGLSEFYRFPQGEFTTDTYRTVCRRSL